MWVLKPLLNPCVSMDFSFDTWAEIAGLLKFKTWFDTLRQDDICLLMRTFLPENRRAELKIDIGIRWFELHSTRSEGELNKKCFFRSAEWCCFLF